MRKGERLTAALLSLVFLALSGCLLLAGEGILRDEGVSVLRVASGGVRGTLFLPALLPEQTVTIPEEDHAHRVTTGGRCAAALVLAGRFDGARTLAAELARRGVAALIPDGNVPASEAWEWLSGQPFVRESSVALIAAESRAAAALSLGRTLAPTDRAAAAAILRGEEDTLRLAADYPGRNLLILTDREPAEEAKAAFFGADYDAGRRFSGYFSEGTARAAVTVPGRLSARPALVTVMDWQGSALGHAVELADDDVICGRVVCCRIGAALCVGAAAVVRILRRRTGGTAGST